MLCFGCEPADEGDPRYIRRRDRRPSSHQRCRQLSVARGPPGGRLAAAAPIFVFAIGLAWCRPAPRAAGRLCGVTTGLGGVVLIAGVSALVGLGEAAAGQAAIIVATISSAVGAIYGRRFAAVA